MMRVIGSAAQNGRRLNRMKDKLKKKRGQYPVYCAADPNHCGPDEVFLGYSWLGLPLRCDRCGRWTAPNNYKWKKST